MGYKYLVKREKGFIKDFKKEYSTDKNYSAPQGWEVIDTSSQEYQDYMSGEGDYKEVEDFKNQKINLKMRIDAGNSLGLDMTEEENKLNNLIGG
jgi:hypothetical protein